ncbi:hypothetical protein QL093DRAFT_1239654 [Fusarium oxysporum]|nr:hypothetical protein QL093DRAFT_1239654 [Fusarium oxysporum]
MTDRRPILTLPLPARDPFESQQPGSSLQSPSIRSPRFHEDFDAPFSLDIMNASRTTLATDTMSYPSTGTTSRNSFGCDGDRPPPLQYRNASWESETKRRSKVNDRILEWAKRSWELFARGPTPRMTPRTTILRVTQPRAQQAI